MRPRRPANNSACGWPAPTRTREKFQQAFVPGRSNDCAPPFFSAHASFPPGLDPALDFRILYLVALLGLCLLVWIMHEGVQILAAGAWPGWMAELINISVDLAGACPRLALVSWVVGR
jgi:hypothetical protein